MLLWLLNLGLAGGVAVAPLGVADPCDTFIVLADAALMVASDSATFTIGSEDGFSVTSDHAFVVPGCP